MSKKSTGKKSEKKKSTSKKTGKSKTEKTIENDGQIKIECQTRIAKVTIKPKSGELQFKGMDMRADQIRRMSIWCKEQEPLILEIDDKNVVTAGKIKKCITTEKGDEPAFDGLNYSSTQYQKLAEIVKSECEVKIVIIPDTQGLFQNNEAKEKEDSENLFAENE